MSKPKNPFTPKDASRIQSTTAKKNGGIVPKDSFASYVQSVVARNTGSGKWKK